MDSKIIALIAGSFLLTGCITSKVDRLHATTSQLSTDVDNYVVMSNRNIDLNQKADLKLKQTLMDLRLKDADTTKSSKDIFDNDSLALNSTLVQMYYSYNNSELFKQQNKYISEYFKQLPKILEEKEIGNSVQGLVNNIDVLNQVIEKNITIADDFKGRLKPNEASLIESTLSNSFKIYQYHKFRQAIDRPYDVIIEALSNQKTYIFSGNEALFLSLNQKAYKNREALVDSYNNQISQAKSLPFSERVKLTYKDEDFKKLMELSQQPYNLQRVDTVNQPVNSLSRERSMAYKKICSTYTIDDFNNQYGNAGLPQNTFDGKIGYQPNSPTYKYNFDIEQLALRSAEVPICELIDIVGLLKEKKYSQVESTSLNRGVAEYNKILNFIDPDGQKK